MDQWFNQLYEIIGKQIESKKTEMILPEIYSELDILARKQNIEELHEIYEFTESNNPIKTNDVTYNKNAYHKLKKEILKRHVMLRDFSILNRDINAYIHDNDQKKINKLLNTWKDSTYVHNYLEEIVFNAKKAKKVYRPEEAKKTVRIKPVVIKEKPLVLTPEPKKEPELELETKPSPKNVIEKKEDLTVSKRGKLPKKNITPEVFIESDSFIETEVILKPKQDRELPKPRVTKVVEKKQSDEVVEVETKPITIVPSKGSYELFFDFVDIISKKYRMIVNVEMLRKLSNPKPNFSRFLLQYIDENDRNSRFFIELFKLLTEYDLVDLITYIIEKSFIIKKLCTYNIGLLNETDLNTKIELLDIVVKQNFIFIKMSDLERKVRFYIDNLGLNDTTTKVIKNKVFEISKFAPLMMESFYATDALGYFKVNFVEREDKGFDPDNLSHLYWAMMLGASTGVYVLRSKYTDFIESMDVVTEMAIHLIKKTDDLDIKFAVKTLATSYIRRIYKIGTQLPDYGDWWARHKDDMLESKHKGLAILNPID